MLYNPTWKKDRTRGLDDLLSWLATKNPNETYVYTDPTACPACRYNQSLGQHYEVPRYVFHFGNFDRQLESCARGERDYYAAIRHTYGAMYHRVAQLKNSWFQRWIG